MPDRRERRRRDKFCLDMFGCCDRLPPINSAMGEMMRRWIWLASVISLITLFMFGKAEAGAAADKIKFPHSAISWNSLPWWMAKDAGHFEKNGLDVDLFYEGASSVIVQAMLAGDAQFAGIAGPAIISNVLSGGDVIQIVAVVKTFTIPMFSQPQIKEVAQHNEQKIAVSRFGSISDIAARNIFQKFAVTGTTVLQSGGTPESAAMLMSGTVAAAMVPAPQSIMLREKGFRELVGVKQFREWNIPVVENGVAARRSFVDKNPSVAVRFIRSAFEGIKSIYNNKELAIRTLAKYSKINDEKKFGRELPIFSGRFEQGRFYGAGSVQRAHRTAGEPKVHRRSGQQKIAGDRLLR